MTNSDSAIPVGPYVVLGGPPFEHSANQTSLQMFEAIGAERPVLYVCRRYQGSALRGLIKGRLGKTTTMLRPGLHNVSRNRFVLVLPPIADFLPMTYPEISRKFVSLIVKVSIMKALAKLQWKNPVLLAYWWMFPELTAMKTWRFSVFDLIDRHWGYGYEQNDRIRQRNFRLAIQTAQAADKVKSVSEVLIKELARYTQADLLPNAIDLSRVDVASSGHDAVRAKLAVYAGGWNERLDVDLLLQLVERNEDWTFHFLGAAVDARFAHFNNVRFFGDVSYDVVISQLSQAQIGLVPFVSNAYTESSNLLKILDYLATGVTVGATKLDSFSVWAERYPSHFKILDDTEEWDHFFATAGERYETGNANCHLDLSQFGTRNRARSLVEPPNQVGGVGTVPQSSRRMRKNTA